MARWYIIHAYSGFEGKVRDSIMAEATRLGLDRLVEQIEVPTETVTEARRGKKVAEILPAHDHKPESQKGTDATVTSAQMQEA